MLVNTPSCSVPNGHIPVWWSRPTSLSDTTMAALSMVGELSTHKLATAAATEELNDVALTPDVDEWVCVLHYFCGSTKSP